MTTKYTVHLPDQPQGTVTADGTPASRKTGALFPEHYYAKISMWLGLFAGVLTVVLGLRFNWPFIDASLWGLTVGIGVMSLSGFYLYWEAATRDWRLETGALKKRELDAARERWLAENTEDFVNVVELLDGEGLDYTARLMLEWYYLDGHDVTRRACEPRGVTQSDWNRVTEALKLARIKKRQGHGFEQAITPQMTVSERAGLYLAALDTWRNVSLVEGEGIRVSGRLVK